MNAIPPDFAAGMAVGFLAAVVFLSVVFVAFMSVTDPTKWTKS